MQKSNPGNPFNALSSRILPDSLKIIRNAYIATLSHRPDTKLIENPGWIQTITPSQTFRWFNRVIFSELGENADQVIHQTLKIYSGSQAGCEWILWPDTKPSNTEKLLLEAGFEPAETSEGMILETSRHTSIQTPENLSIRRPELHEIKTYVDVMANGWDSRVINRDMACQRMQKLFHQNEFFWVFDGETPIATSETEYVPHSGYLCGSTVLPGYRGRGAYRLMVKARLEAMEKRDVKTASTITLSKTSAPILKKLGFHSSVQIRYFAIRCENEKRL